MATDYKFEGWMGLDASSVEGKMVWKDYEPKVWEENDVDIRITHSGICGSDLHTLRSGWVSTITNSSSNAPPPAPCQGGHLALHRLTAEEDDC